MRIVRGTHLCFFLRSWLACITLVPQCDPRFERSISVFFFFFFFFSFLFFIVVAFRFFAFFSLSSSTVWTESKQKRDFFTYLRTKKFLGVKHLTEWSLAPYSSHCDQFWFIVSSDTDYFDYSTSWKSEYHTRNVVEIYFQIERLFSLCLVLNPFETSCSIYLFLSSNLNSS